MSDWRARRSELTAAAADGDVGRTRVLLDELLASEQSPRLFALGAKLARSLGNAAELASRRVEILRSFTVEPMVAPLQTFALRRGVSLDVEVADYDQFEQILLTQRAGAGADVIVLLSQLTDLDPRLGATFPALSDADASTVISTAAERPRHWIAAARQRYPGSTIIVGGVAVPEWPAYGLADAAVAIGHQRAAEELNEALRVACRGQAGVVFFDIDTVLASIGRANSFDARMWAHARQPYSPAALFALGDRLARIIAADSLPRRKCIVLDCDNTLWGGVVGEDGADGIALGPEYPGSAFVAFQEALLALQKRGILLALASKNNEGDVLEIVANHRYQVLRAEHIAAHSIGWQDKATGIEGIAAELNIGVDSMVFIDDSDYECALIRERLPQVEVIQTPSKPLDLVPLVSRIESLDALTISETDRQRGSMYKAQAARSRAEKQAPSLDDFLGTLGLEIDISDVASAAEVERAAQLCQRTNQLNVTTRRHHVADIEAFVADPHSEVRIVRLRDRFGDYGICGLTISTLSEAGSNPDFEAGSNPGANAVADVDTFLLSCRVIGRGVETALGCDLDTLWRKRGATHINATFVPSAKNMPAAELFDRLGFSREAGGDGVRYRLSLGREPPAMPDWFTVSR